MIAVYLQMQVLVCTVCGETLEIPRSLLRDQHGLLELQDETRADHRECAKNPHDVPRAIEERSFRKRVERARQRTNDRRQPRPRCSGRPTAS